eukprot:6045592-Amphidinium_carterae.1
MDAPAAPLFDLEVTLPTRMRESNESRTDRINELVSSAMQAAIAQTAMHGPISGLERTRPGAETPLSISSEEDVLQW